MTDVVLRQAVIDAIDAIYQECPAETIQRTLFANAIAAINAIPSLESVDALVKAARDYLDCTNTGGFEEQLQSEDVLKAALSAFDVGRMTYSEAVDIVLARGNRLATRRCR
jgi:hypothetical protein